jgi:hypothetical protein
MAVSVIWVWMTRSPSFFKKNNETELRWSYLRGRPSCINRQILFVERAQPKACRSNSYHSETESLARHWRLDFSNSVKRVTFSPGAFAELGRGRCRKTNPGIDQRLECREGVGYRGGEVLLPGRRRPLDVGTGTTAWFLTGGPNNIYGPSQPSSHLRPALLVAPSIIGSVLCSSSCRHSTSAGSFTRTESLSRAPTGACHPFSYNRARLVKRAVTAAS